MHRLFYLLVFIQLFSLIFVIFCVVEICGSGVVTSMDDVATTTVVVSNVVLILDWLIDIEDGVGSIDDELIRGTDDKGVVDTDKERVESDG